MFLISFDNLALELTFLLHKKGKSFCDIQIVDEKDKTLIKPYF